MDLTIFKAYDIRGLYPSEINEEISYKIGRALPVFSNTKEVVIGMDGRPSSPLLKDQLIKGINESGASVIDLGLVTTPMLSFAVKNLNLKCGVMISASHNPVQYNAFKIIGEKAKQLSQDSGLVGIKNIVEKGQFEKVKSNNINNTIFDILPIYLNDLLSKFTIQNNINVVADFGNGMGSINTIPAFKNIPAIKSTYMFEKIDCTFPNHFADPHHLENMKLLQEKVISEKADIGLFFDGDADRCYFIDEQGNVVLADIAFCLLVEEEIKKTKIADKTVYYDLRFTKEIKKLILSLGGKPKMMRVGNPYYKEKLIDEGGLMASEFSGHVMYAEHFGIDDGLFAALKMIEIISNKNIPLSKLVNKYKAYYSHPEISISVKGKDIDKILNVLKSEYIDGHEIVIDGLYIEYPNWWFNLRKSNTEPVVRLRIEAEDQDTLDLQKEKIMNIINK